MSNQSKHDSATIGRNAPCPCGSGRKFKKCGCGRFNSAIREAAEVPERDLPFEMPVCGCCGEPVTISDLRVAAELGHAQNQYVMGLLHEDGFGVPQDDRRAFEWFRRAAEQGLAGAQCSLGFMYLMGRGVAQDDATAVSWIQKSASQNDADAHAYLWLMYRQGNGVEQNSAEAERHFEAAVKGGIPADELLSALERPDTAATANTSLHKDAA